VADDQDKHTIEQPPAGVAEAEPVAETAVPEAADELGTLRRELDEARAREAEYLDGWQRARAELANARKRFQRDQEQAYSNAAGQVLLRLLPIVDDFERALSTLPAELAGQPWVDGIALMYRKLQHLLEAEGVSPIEAEGQAFDPAAHQAVTHEPSDDVPEGHVIGQVQRGYRLGDRVLRPAVVRVSSGPSPAADAEAD
jgi:molecular chaperone GrpE